MNHAKIAEPFLKLQDTEIVYVADSGRVWINNPEAEMKAYFDARGEKYKVFTRKKK